MLTLQLTSHRSDRIFQMLSMQFLLRYFEVLFVFACFFRPNNIKTAVKFPLKVATPTTRSRFETLEQPKDPIDSETTVLLLRMKAEASPLLNRIRCLWATE